MKSALDHAPADELGHKSARDEWTRASGVGGVACHRRANALEVSGVQKHCRKFVSVSAKGRIKTRSDTFRGVMR